MTLRQPACIAFPVASTAMLPRCVCTTLAILLLVLVIPASTLSQSSLTREPALLDNLNMVSLGTAPIVTHSGLVIWVARTGEMLEGGWWDAEIRGARLPDLELFVIATGLADVDGGHPLLATDGQVVVWSDRRDRLTIHGVRLDSGGSFIVAELEPSADGWGSRIGSLAVSDNLVAWSAYDAEVARLQVRDITGRNPIITLDETPTIEAGFPEIGAVAVDSEWVVWGRHRNNVSWEQVIAHNIDTGDEFTIENPGEGRLAANALRNGVLALPVNQGDKNIENPDIALIDVQMIDLRTREVSIVTIQYEEHIAERSSYPYADMFLGFDGRYLYQEFQISLPTSKPGLQQMVAYDTWTGASFGIGRDIFWLFRAGDGILAWDMGGLIYAVGLTDRLPTAPVSNMRIPSPDYFWFSETGHYLQLVFKSYWESNGGLPVFGYPLTEEFHERNVDTGHTYVVQFTERQRFEWHPDNAGTPYEVLLGRLGSELLTVQGRDWTNFPKADPTSPHYFPETGQAIAPEFQNYWASHGLEFGDDGVTFRESLALFGYPLSPPMMETNADGDTVLTQYFERAVFEYQPANADPYTVLLRRLGAEMLVERDW